MNVWTAKLRGNKASGVWWAAAFVLGSLAGAQAAAQSPEFKKAIEENTYQFDSDSDGSLSGPGLEFFLEATRDVQFVVFGEPHNVDKVPRFFTKMFRALQDEHGFEYAALEAGPVIMEMASIEPVRGDLDALKQLYAEYPNSFTWYTDQEFEMIAEIGAASNAKIPPVWGLDQVFGTLHVLDELAGLAPDEDVKGRVNGIANKVRETYFSRVFHDRLISADTDVFADLREWFAPEAGSRAAFLIEQLEVSHSAYRGNILAGEGQMTGYRSNVEREENMKHLFMRQYRRALDSGDSLPKVIFKFGHWHVMKGRNPGNAFTLGNFLMEFAKSNGMTSFNIAATIINEPDQHFSITEKPEYDPISRMGSPDALTIVDTRPLRPYVHAGAAGDIHPSLRDWVFQYEAVLLIGDTARGTREFEKERARAHRRTR